MLALIDHDLVVFRCAASAENDDLGIAIYRAEALLDELLTKTGCTEYRAFLSGKSNFRKTIYPEYKANRTAPKPIHLAALREHALEKMGAEMAPEGLEADDAMGINQTDDTVIVSLDKDMLMIPGKHFSWEIKGKGWVKPDTWTDQTKIGGLKLFFEQCLKGDTADNIKGIEKIGPKKAQIILAGCETEQQLFNAVRDAYGNDEEFIMNASVLWIMQSLDDVWKDRFDAYI
jgi:5'-3' exonuclease